jgi:TonB family protein
VEVPDGNEVAEAPDDAAHLSDKNRDVAEETAAADTNLEKQRAGEAPESAPSDDTTSDDVGGPDDVIDDLEDSEATTDQRVAASDRSGEDDAARGAIAGEEGDDGEEGTGEQPEPGALAMRGVEGRGDVVDRGRDGKRAGRRGKSGLRTQLAFDDYERIVGRERADRERELAQRERSMKKGRYQQRLDAVRSALENFTPDVKVGNQTALKTRAHPFAVYLARMHRRIHELWGFGFLDDLDGKPADHPLNDFDLVTSVEVAVNPDGTVHKMTVVKGSGELEFDVAALHTVAAAAPYEQTPEKIRSVDGRVYLRWGFHRNWRQCGTFNVEPYILTDIPGAEPLPAEMDTRDGGTRGDVVADVEGRAPPPGPGHDGGAPPAGHRHAHPGGSAAAYAANLWVSGFTSGRVERMVQVSALPFYGGATVAAQTPEDLEAVYAQLLAESGRFRAFEVLDAAAYAARATGPVQLPEGALVLAVQAAERFAVVLTPTRSGEYRATAVVR